MGKTEDSGNKFGLVGKNISYSFSKGYFTSKFKALGLGEHSYENFDLTEISAFKKLVADTSLKGLNVTIPYKEEVIPYLDELDDGAAAIGAVNTIKFTPKGLKGYNTDAYGFKNALQPFLKAHHKKALLLGTGGASKAIAHVLDTLGIDYCFVSRNATRFQMGYEELTKTILNSYTIVINCSPVGTFPNVDAKPNIPYGFIGKEHLFFDLIYNPAQTAFLKEAEKKGASFTNGLAMLEYQAEKAWEIWNKD